MISRIEMNVASNMVWRPVLAALILCLGGVTEAFAQRQVGHSQCCGRQDVILIRGGAGYWPGAQAMADYLASLGYKPTIIQHWEAGAVADEITLASREGRMAGGVVIVGYSTGADTACVLARRLGENGIRVQTMVLIESTFGFSVPANVDYCVNYYASRRFDLIPVFRGVAIDVESNATTLYNIDVKQHPEYAYLAERNHFTMCNTPMIQQLTGQIVASRQPAVIPQLGTKPAQSEGTVANREEKQAAGKPAEPSSPALVYGPPERTGSGSPVTSEAASAADGVLAGAVPEKAKDFRLVNPHFGPSNLKRTPLEEQESRENRQLPTIIFADKAGETVKR